MLLINKALKKGGLCKITSGYMSIVERTTIPLNGEDIATTHVTAHFSFY